MAKKKKANTPSFILELPLDCNPSQALELKKRMNAGRQLYNAVLSEGYKRVRLLRQSRLYQQALHTQRGPERTSLFKQAREEVGFSEYGLHGFVDQMAHTFVGELLCSDTRQTLATRAYRALNEYVLGKRGRPRFKNKTQVPSVEGKSKNSALKFVEGGLQWYQGFHIPAKLDPDNKLVAHAFAHPLKYVRLVRRVMRGKESFFVQLVCQGHPYQKKDKYPLGQQKVGLDVGPTNAAVVGEDAAFLTPFCPELQNKDHELRRLQRKLDRQRRANNPKNYKEDGTIKKGKKMWARSRAMRQTEAELRELHRRLAAHRKNLHGVFVRNVLLIGCHIKCEKVSYRAWQKMFGKSIGRSGPGMAMERLKRKAVSAGGYVHEFPTRNTWLSQVCICGDKKKKPLSQRTHKCEKCGTQAQRDLFSAYLARFVEGNELKVSFARKAWEGANGLLQTAYQLYQVASVKTSSAPLRKRSQSRSYANPKKNAT